MDLPEVRCNVKRIIVTCTVGAASVMVAVFGSVFIYAVVKARRLILGG